MKFVFFWFTFLMTAPWLAAIQTGSLTDEGYAQFFRGKLRNLSLSHQGELESAPRLVEVARLEQPVVWAALSDADGNLVLGTGNRGEVVQMTPAGQFETRFAPDAVLSRALALAPDGSVLVGTSPDGAIYRLPPDGGRPEIFVDLPETYLWSLVLEEDALWITTGLAARLYRVPVSADLSEVGEPEVWFESSDNHFPVLVRDGDRWLVGASGKGIVYAVTDRQTAFAVANVDEEEIRTLQVSPDGTLVFSSYSENRSGGPGASVAGADGVSPGELPPFVVTAGGAGQPEGRSGTATGTGLLYRTEPNGFTQALWRSGRAGIFSLVRLSSRYWLGGTNDEGKLFYFADRNDWGLLHQLPRGGEVAAIVPSGDGSGYYVVSSNPGVVYRLGGVSDAAGVFESRVLDARQPVRWGAFELSLGAPGSVEIATRTGNTATADATWSEWQALKDDTIQSPISRFLQYRVTFPGNSPARLLRARAFYQMPNVAPQIVAIRVLPFGADLQSMQVPNNTLDFSAVFRDGPAGRPDEGGEERLKLLRRPEQTLRTIVWRAHDPNGDPLRFEVAIRSTGDSRWTVLARDLTDPAFTFNAAGLTPGHYQVRLTASDHMVNPPDSAQRVAQVSDVVLIDSTPPVIETVEAESDLQRLVVRVTSDVSRLVAAQARISGDEPFRLRPRDGLFDQYVETFEIPLPGDLEEGASIVFEVLDESGNQAMHTVTHRH